MTYLNSNYTGKTPRSLQSAFGPYTSNEINDHKPMDWQDKVVLTSCTITLVFVILLMIF